MYNLFDSRNTNTSHKFWTDGVREFKLFNLFCPFKCIQKKMDYFLANFFTREWEQLHYEAWDLMINRSR